eukprot:11179128-Lingulodinium_polyedra.AAC.1
MVGRGGVAGGARWAGPLRGLGRRQVLGPSGLRKRGTGKGDGSPCLSVAGEGRSVLKGPQ